MDETKDETTGPRLHCRDRHANAVDSCAVHYTAIYARFIPDIAGLTYPPVRSEPPLRCYAQLKPALGSKEHTRVRTRIRTSGAS